MCLGIVVSVRAVIAYVHVGDVVLYLLLLLLMLFGMLLLLSMTLLIV